MSEKIVSIVNDIGVGLTAWINVLALLFLCPHAIKALRQYEDSVKEGKE